MMHDYFDMVCTISDRYFQVRLAKPAQAMCPDFAMYAQVSDPMFFMPCMTEERMNACPHTAAFARKFQRWIRNVAWGEGEPISGLEMYFAFALESGWMVPVQIKEKQYTLRSESVVADQFKLDLSRQSRVWINFLIWWLEGIDSPIQLVNVKALKQLGYGIVVRGFLKRPQMSQSIAAQHELRKYFQQTIDYRYIKSSANHGVSVPLWEVDDMEKNNSSEVYICL